MVRETGRANRVAVLSRDKTSLLALSTLRSLRRPSSYIYSRQREPDTADHDTIFHHRRQRYVPETQHAAAVYGV